MKKQKQKWYGVFDPDSSYSTVTSSWDEALAFQMAVRNSHGRTLLLRKFQERDDAAYFSRCGRMRTVVAQRGGEEEAEGIIDVYTDGSASQGWAGCGVFFYTGSPMNVSSAFPFENHTNNRAELYAIFLAIHTVRRNKPRTRRLRVHTDSQYSINALTTWREAWTRSSFKGDTIANRDIVEMLWVEMDAASFAIEFVWVSGHSGIRGNHEADALANEGRTKAVQQPSSNNLT